MDAFDPRRISPRFVKSPVSLEAVKRRILTFADDVGIVSTPDLIVRCDGRLFLGIHRGEVSPLGSLLTGRLKLEGRKELFLAFPRLFPVAPGETILHRIAWSLRRAWRGWRNGGTR